MSTSPNTVPQPTAEQLRKNWQNRNSKNSKIVDIDVGQKYAVVSLLLSPGVTQPDDYAALGAAITAITGITGVKLLVDGDTVDSVPAGEELKMVAKVAIRQVTA